MTLKKELAFKITSEIKSEEDAKKAELFFEAIFQKKNIDTEIPTIKIQKDSLSLVDLIYECNFARSKGDARRLIEQGAVHINGEKCSVFNQNIDLKNSQTILKVGRQIAKIEIQ